RDPGPSLSSRRRKAVATGRQAAQQQGQGSCGEVSDHQPGGLSIILLTSAYWYKVEKPLPCEPPRREAVAIAVGHRPAPCADAAVLPPCGPCRGTSRGGDIRGDCAR